MVDHVFAVGLLVPIHREITVDDAHAIIYDLIGLGKIVAASILVDGAAATQFGEFFDEPGQSVLIGRLVTNRDVNLNANLWREAGQGASFSIRKYSSTGGGIQHPKSPLSLVSLGLQPWVLLDIDLSFFELRLIIIRRPFHIKLGIISY